MVLRIYRPEGLTEKAPVVMEVHGGGWVGGSLRSITTAVSNSQREHLVL